MADQNEGGGLGSLLGPVGIGLGVLQTGINIVDSIAAKKRRRKLLAQEKAFVTPKEIDEILEATKANASQGFDATTLNFLTNQTDQAFSSSLGAATRLNADPNSLSALFGQKVNSIMKIGAENHRLNTENFTAYLNALSVKADNEAAEQKSEQDILRNKIQAESANIESAGGNIGEGISTILATLSAEKLAGLYNPDGTRKRKNSRTPNLPFQAGSLLGNGLPMGNYSDNSLFR